MSEADAARLASSTTMTLVTGVFGMNVTHLPGANSFPLVMLLILASGGITLALLFWRRLL